MGKRGDGYGSEDHFLRYREARAETFDQLLLAALHAEALGSPGTTQQAATVSASRKAWPSSMTGRMFRISGAATGPSVGGRRPGMASRNSTPAPVPSAHPAFARDPRTTPDDIRGLQSGTGAGCHLFLSRPRAALACPGKSERLRSRLWVLRASRLQARLRRRRRSPTQWTLASWRTQRLMIQQCPPSCSAAHAGRVGRYSTIAANAVPIKLATPRDRHPIRRKFLAQLIPG